MDLQGRIAQKAAELCLRNDFGGHQIQEHDLQRTDLLGLCPGLTHNKDIFLLQYFRCGQVIGYPDGQKAILLSKQGVAQRESKEYCTVRSPEPIAIACWIR